MFEAATRNKLRFPSGRGPLTVEQLWDVPLRSKDNFDLNAIAKAINAELKTTAEESFVDSNKSPAQGKLELAFDIVKHVITKKVAEEKAAMTRAANQAEKARLLEILAKKQDDKLEGLTEAQIQKKIRDLDLES